eukprot:69593-Rhodomonas_salina.1
MVLPGHPYVPRQAGYRHMRPVRVLLVVVHDSFQSDRPGCGTDLVYRRLSAYAPDRPHPVLRSGHP